MAFGIYLEDELGNPWYWDACRNFQLIDRHDHKGVPNIVDTGVSVSRPCFIFWQVTKFPDLVSIPNMGFGKGKSGNWEYAFTELDTAHTTTANTEIRVFIFSDYAPHLPRYGVAIWDEKGDLAITNESKLLRIAGTFPPANIGERIPIAGSYAIMPLTTGSCSWFNPDGYDEVSDVYFGTSAHLEGGVTILSNGLAMGGDAWTTMITRPPPVVNGRYKWDQLAYEERLIDTPIPYINVDEYL